MRDWEQLVRQRLCARGETAALNDEVIREVAHHLEDAFERSRESGLSEEDSANRAWNEVRNWPRLAREIHRAKGGVTMLKDRIQRLWLPGIVPAFLALGVLVAFATIGYKLRLQSTSSSFATKFYYGWLIALPLFGATSAYWSRRAGGSLGNRVTASLFLAEALLATFVILFAAQLILLPFGLGGFHRNNLQWGRFVTEVGRGGLAIVLLPAVMLFVGALPFLRAKPARQGRAAA